MLFHIFPVSFDHGLERRIRFFKLTRSPGYLAKAQAQALGYLPLGHAAVQKLHQLPAGRYLVNFIFGEYAPQKLLDEVFIISIGENPRYFLKLVHDKAGYVSIKRNIAPGHTVMSSFFS